MTSVTLEGKQEIYRKIPETIPHINTIAAQASVWTYCTGVYSEPECNWEAFTLLTVIEDSPLISCILTHKGYVGVASSEGWKYRSVWLT